MGHIKEPKGVDLIINSRPLTKEEEIAISEYIRSYKAKHSHREASTKLTGRKARRKILEKSIKEVSIGRR